MVSGAVFLNYWRSRQFHPACQRLAILLRILPQNSHEIFTSLYRHPGVGVITRQRGSVYHGGRCNLGSLFRNQASINYAERAPFCFQDFEECGGDETIIMDQSFGAFLLRVCSINLHATLIARHPLSFSLSTSSGEISPAGLNSGILDTKQTEAEAFHFGRRLSGWVRLRKLNVI